MAVTQLLPILGTEMQYLKLNIMGRVQVGGNIRNQEGKKWLVRDLGYLPRSVFSGAATCLILAQPGAAAGFTCFCGSACECRYMGTHQYSWKHYHPPDRQAALQAIPLCLE